MLTSKFFLLPKEKQELILQEAKEKGNWKTAETWALEVGISINRLYKQLRKLNPNETPKNENGERKLSKEEKDFLKRLGSGEATYDETSRFVAVRVFEKMLKNPDKWQYLDFFRTELIKVKREEAQIKDAWAKEIIGKMFAGKLPPKNCPNCGHNLMETKIVEGEILSKGEIPKGVLDNGQKRIASGV